MLPTVTRVPVGDAEKRTPGVAMCRQGQGWRRQQAEAQLQPPGARSWRRQEGPFPSLQRKLTCPHLETPALQSLNERVPTATSRPGCDRCPAARGD